MPEKTPIMHIDLDRCRKMYEPGDIGALHVPGFIDPVSLDLLRTDIENLLRQGRFIPAQKIVGKVHQSLLHMDIGYRGDGSGALAPINPIDAKAIAEFADLYVSTIYNPISRLDSGFNQISKLNATEINIYYKNDGIGYHRDHKVFENLIAALTIAGSARMSFSRSRDGTDAVSFLVKPGDMVLMRGHRRELLPDEAVPRPFHEVVTLGDLRYSIIFRQMAHPAP